MQQIIDIGLWIGCKKRRGDTMKLRKAKRFNTVESYAICACPMASCSCWCSCSSDLAFTTPYNRNDQSIYDRNRYDTVALSI